MPLLDLDLVTPGVVILDTADIESINPHRGCMRQIDRVLWIDEKPTSAIGEKDITEKLLKTLASKSTKPLPTS